MQIYVDPGYRNLGLNPFEIRDGVLAITSEPTDDSVAAQLENMPYTPGVLTTEHTQVYGYFEVSARIPEGQGLWPAFWMVGDGNYGDEIDVFEVPGDRTERVYQTLHRPGYDKTQTSIRGIDSADSFHTYGLEMDARRDRLVY